MHYWSMCLQILQAIFTCSHARALAVEGKTFCPDCGKGVVFQWRVLRCSGCGHRRESRYLFRKIVPMEICCTSCGESNVEQQRLVDPEYFQLRHALLCFETDHSERTLLQSLSVTLADIVRGMASSSNEVTRMSLRLPS